MTLEERLGALERQLRRYRNTTAVLALLLVAALTVAAHQEKVHDSLKTRALQVVNDKGRIAAVLGRGDGGGGLMLWNESGAQTVTLVSGEDGAQLHLARTDNSRFLSAAACKDRDLLKIMDKHGGERFKAVTLGTGAAGVVVKREGGKPGITMMEAKQLASILVANKDGKTVVDMGFAGNAGGITINNDKGVRVADLRADAAGAGNLVLSRATTIPFLIARSNARGEMLLLCERDGEARLEAKVLASGQAALSILRPGEKPGVFLHAGNTETGMLATDNLGRYAVNAVASNMGTLSINGKEVKGDDR